MRREGSAPAGIRTQVIAVRGQYDWPDYSPELRSVSPCAVAQDTTRASGDLLPCNLLPHLSDSTDQQKNWLCFVYWDKTIRRIFRVENLINSPVPILKALEAEKFIFI